MFALLCRKRTQKKARGELGVLAFINKWLNLILSRRSLSTSHLFLTGNLEIVSFPKFSDLRSYLFACYTRFTFTWVPAVDSSSTYFYFLSTLLPPIAYLSSSYLFSLRSLLGTSSLRRSLGLAFGSKWGLVNKRGCLLIWGSTVHTPSLFCQRGW